MLTAAMRRMSSRLTSLTVSDLSPYLKLRFCYTPTFLSASLLHLYLSFSSLFPLPLFQSVLSVFALCEILCSPWLVFITSSLTCLLSSFPEFNFTSSTFSFGIMLFGYPGDGSRGHQVPEDEGCICYEGCHQWNTCIPYICVCLQAAGKPQIELLAPSGDLYTHKPYEHTLRSTRCCPCTAVKSPGDTQ